MTDNEIIKALECCRKAKTKGDCLSLGCPASTLAGCRYVLRTDEDFEGVIYYEMLKDALDLINRQKAEIERLTLLANGFASAVAQDVESCERCACKLLDERDSARAEADRIAEEYSDLIIEKDELFDIAEKQKAEIYELTINMNAARLGMMAEHERLKTARAEAVKEFCKRRGIEYVEDDV